LVLVGSLDDDAEQNSLAALASWIKVSSSLALTISFSTSKLE